MTLQRQLNIQSPAKINLGLKVLNKRPDGYHSLYTIFQTVAFFDEIILTYPNLHGKPRFFTDAPFNLPFDTGNTIYKACQLMEEYCCRPIGIDITLKKRIPAGAGLAGGSGNAAAILWGLNQLLELELTNTHLQDMALKIGMDVPFFISGASAIGTDRGEKLFPLSIDYEEFSILLVFPDFSIQTAEIYQAYKFPLTKSDFFIKIEALLNLPDYERIIKLSDLIEILENDLERVAMIHYPQLELIAGKLRKAGADGVLMSGSGSTLFALFRPEKMRSMEVLSDQLLKMDVRSIVCKPIQNRGWEHFVNIQNGGVDWKSPKSVSP